MAGSRTVPRPVIDLSDLGAGGPGLAPNDGHVESLIAHYSNLLAAAASEGMVRTDTGRAMADDPGLLARHMAARHSAWTVDDAARYLARHVDDPVTFRRVLTEALSDPDVMTVLPESDEHPERLLSTWSRLQLEADLMADAEILAGRDMALPGAPATAAERLTSEQRETLEELFAGPALQIVDGDAGAGKSVVAAALHDAAARAGVPASMVVPTGNDAALARAMVANPASVQTARQPLPVGEEPRLFILDSAESFSPEETAQVLRAALRNGSKVVMAGDQRSLEPMAGASPYAALCERLGVRSLSGSLRAKSPAERDFVRHMSRGTPDSDQAAVDYLAAHGRLAGAADTGGAIENAVTAYLADRTPDKVMIAHTRAQVRALNAGLMARLEGREGQVVRTLGGGSIDLAVGDVVVVQRAAPRVGGSGAPAGGGDVAVSCRPRRPGLRGTRRGRADGGCRCVDRAPRTRLGADNTLRTRAGGVRALPGDGVQQPPDSLRRVHAPPRAGPCLCRRPRCCEHARAVAGHVRAPAVGARLRLCPGARRPAAAGRVSGGRRRGGRGLARHDSPHGPRAGDGPGDGRCGRCPGRAAGTGGGSG